MPMLSNNVAGVINRLERGRALNVKCKKIVESEIKRRLSEYELIDHRFSTKYGMSLSQFEKNQMLKRKKYSYDIEKNYHDWDLAVDGIKTMKKELRQLQKQG